MSQDHENFVMEGQENLGPYEDGQQYQNDEHHHEREGAEQEQEDFQGQNQVHENEEDDEQYDQQHEDQQNNDEHEQEQQQYEQLAELQRQQQAIKQQQALLQQQKQFNPQQNSQQLQAQQQHQQLQKQNQAQGSSKVLSPSKTSKQVMQSVFDSQNNGLEASFQQRSQGEEQEGQNNSHEQMNRIAYNLAQMKINGQNDQQEEDPNRSGNNEEQINEAAEVIDLTVFDKAYKSFLQKIAGDQVFVDASYESKIDILIDFSHDELLDYRLGSLVFLFELIYNFRESLTDAALAQILSSLYSNMRLYYETKDFYMVYTALEIIALVGPHSISFNNIKLLASILIDEVLPILQDKAFLALMNFEYHGLYAILDIANKDFKEIPNYLLNKLAQTEEVQLAVIIPSLLNDIASADSKKKISSLCALNRMHSMIWKANSLPLLINLLNEGTLDRQLIVSTIRACGEIGEQTLLKARNQFLLNILKQTNNSKIKMAICTVMSWRVRKHERNALKINIVPFNFADHYNVNPGTMCVYYGNHTPLAFVEEDDNEVNSDDDCIEINSRDFMAALQRLLSVKFEKLQSTQDNDAPHNYKQFIRDFTLIKLIDPAAFEEEQEPKISSAIIKSLCNLLHDDNSQVRETAVSALGLIGPPEGEESIEALYNSLKDSDSQVRALAAWCLGKLGEASSMKVAKRLILLLRDSYWKVRTAACVSLGSLGAKFADIIFPPLTKILRDGSINRVTVCETLIRLGVHGEQILIDLLKSVPQSNFKLKTAIIQSFELADVHKPTIDFIIEELFKNANDKMIEVRRACLQTLDILRTRAQETNITYLKSQNVLPLLYYFLQDLSPEIRQIALESIQTFGPQAELMFIEGLTKDKNAIIRQECARGLGSLGVQNFRALLFGLRDINESVRKATANAVKNNFIAEQIVEEFSEKKYQLPALLLNIKDIFGLPFYLDEDCRTIFEQVLVSFGETVPKIATQFNTNGVQNYSFEQQQQYGTAHQQDHGASLSGQHQQSQQSESGRGTNQYNSQLKNVQQTHVPAQKVGKNIPNMRGGMPAYTFFKPGAASQEYHP